MKNKIITSILIILPLLSIYKSPISILSLADVMLLIIGVFTMFESLLGLNFPKRQEGKKDKYRHFGPVLLIYFLFFLTLISVLVNGQIMFISVVIRTMRYGIFMYTVSFVGYKYFKSNYAAKVIVNISILATIYIVVQTIVYYSSGKVLPFIIPFLEPMVSEYKDISGLINWYNQFYYRPQSFFMEPAHFSQYTLIALGICLFWKDKSNDNVQIKRALFLSFGLILSTSSIGIIIGVFIWTSFLLRQYNHRLTLKKILILFCLIFMALVVAPFILEIERVTEPITRVFQTSVRTSDSISLFSNLNINQKIFGVGLGNEELYLTSNDRVPFMNSLTIVLLSGGYFGCLAYVLYFLDLVVHKRGISLLLTITLFILSFGSEIFFTYVGVIWLLFIYYDDINDLMEYKI